MGSLTSRQNAGVEEVDIASNHAYKYPPRSGNYFGSHFIMGGERFDTPQPEAYLFGENSDLNFLGNRPTPFPYPPPQANDPTKTLKCLVNIRKESLRLVRTTEQSSSSESNETINAIKNYNDNDIDTNKKSNKYNIEFTFDCDVRCSIKIYYFCTEDITTKGITYLSRDPTINSDTYYYKKGTNQQFIQQSHIIEPKKYHDDDFLYNIDKEMIPIAIHCIADDGNDETKQSHTTIAIIEKHSDDLYLLKALKQKLYVDGLCYLLQEIYGIENKNNDIIKQQGSSDDDNDDNGSECVICMCDVRDTLILPCRHLCLCYGCADSLRYQANNCPICRSPFRALLQIKALQKLNGNVVNNTTLSSLPDGTCDNIPSGYEAVSLIEALNGPYTPRATILPPESPDTPDTDTASAIQAVEVLNRSAERTPILKHVTPKDGELSSTSSRATGTSPCPTPEFRMSVLMAKQEHHCRTPSTKIKHSSDTSTTRDKNTGRVRDTIRLVNEKQSSTHYECQDDDSEAEKLSPLLDSSENSKIHKLQTRDNVDDDEDDDDEDDDDLPVTGTDTELNCHPH